MKAPPEGGLLLLSPPAARVDDFPYALGSYADARPPESFPSGQLSAFISEAGAPRSPPRRKQLRLSRCAPDKELTLAWSKSVDHREHAERLREAAQWLEATNAYKRHLARHPADTESWEHYGDCLRRAGLSLDADLAALIAESTVGATPSSTDPIASSESGERPGRSQARRLIFSLQDFLLFLKDYVTMSGIQRVQAGIALSAIAIPGVDIRFIAVDQADVLQPGDFWEIGRSDLQGLIQYAASRDVDHGVLRGLVDRCHANATVITPGAEDVVILLGCFWSHGNTVDRFLASKRNGARIAAYLYDIIPISHPQFVTSDLSRVFATSLSELCEVADFLLTISDYTRITFAEFLEGLGKPSIPMMTVPLAHALTGPVARTNLWPSALRALKGREYVTYVSTIEGRKNHIYVVNAWRQMIEAGIEVPDLVFVGRKGWRVNGLMDLLNGTNFLDGRVHFVHDVSDGELNAIYEHSLFTVFTSFVEGWGLPVGESLVHRRLCVASATSSIPEVGETFTEYIDPLDMRDGVRVFSRLIQDRGYLRERQENINQNFKPREWSDVAADFVDKTLQMAGAQVVESQAVTFGQGVVFVPGAIWRESSQTGLAMMKPWRLMIAESFYPSEKFGAWMRGRRGKIEFRTELAPGTRIVVYLSLLAAPWANACKVTVSGGSAGVEPAVCVPLGTLGDHGLVMVGAIVGEHQTCTVTLEVRGDFSMPEHEARSFALGLTNFAYADAVNLEARVDIADHFTLTLVPDAPDIAERRSYRSEHRTMAG